MTKRNPAFPVHIPSLDGAETYFGMSLRDWFATHAPEPPMHWHSRQSWPKQPDLEYNKKHTSAWKEAWAAYHAAVAECEMMRRIEWQWHYADAMLKARQ